MYSKQWAVSDDAQRDVDKLRGERLMNYKDDKSDSNRVRSHVSQPADRFEKLDLQLLWLIKQIKLHLINFLQ